MWEGAQTSARPDEEAPLKIPTTSVINIIISKNNGQRKGAFEQRFSILLQEIDALSSRLGLFNLDGFFAFIWQIIETGGLSFISATSRQALAPLRSWLGRAFYESTNSGSNRADRRAWQSAFLAQLQLENQLHDP